MLSNSIKGLLSYQKQLLYKICILSIVLYSLYLQFFNKAPLLYPLKKLRKIQYRAVLQITDTFHISSIWEFEAIASLIPIYLHLQKLSERHQIRTFTLPLNHVISTFFKSRYTNNFFLHCLSLENITTKQQLKIKSFIIDANNYLNGIFPFFNFLSNEFSPGFILIDNFSSCFSFIEQTTKIKKARPLIFIISIISS